MNSNMDLHQQQQQHSYQNQDQNQNPDDLSLKLAVAISLLRSKLLQSQTSQPPPPPSLSHHRDVLHWKRKAKERKQEILKLKKDLNELGEASRYDPVSQVASCKCYFFENLGKFSPNRLGDGSDHKFTDVLRRRFLRQVRFKEKRRKRDGGNQKQHRSDLSNEDEVEQLNAAVDFLVELCDNGSSVEVPNFANWSHQAVDFIIASLRNLLTKGGNLEMIEGMVSSMILRLLRRMCNPESKVQHYMGNDMQYLVQHLIRKLGTEIYIGQRAALAVSQKIYSIAENLLFLDPFDDSFCQMHESMFLLMQLLEFLISDYILTWSATKSFDNLLFEEWLTSVVHARKAVELLESRNGLFVLYMDRIIGGLSKKLAQVPSLLNLNAEVLNMLLI